MSTRQNKRYSYSTIGGCLVLIASLLVAPIEAASTQAGLVQWSFNHHGAKVPVAIWYPTQETPQPLDAGPFTLSAAVGVAIGQRRHPLIVISHGTGGASLAHHPLAEALAAAGFMVAALEHPGDNYRDRSLISDARYFDERPRQITALLRALEQDTELIERIDPARVGAIGHSAGGYAIAAVLGARPDRETLVARCQQKMDDPACDYRDPTKGVIDQATAPFVLPADAHADPVAPGTLKIAAATLLAPLGGVIAADSQIDNRIAIQIIAAEQDAVLPAKYHISPLKIAAPHAEFHVAAGAGHFSFIAPVATKWRDALGEVASDPEGFDRTAFNHRLSAQLTAWFAAALK